MRTPVPAHKVVVVTPFTEGGDLDEPALQVIIDRLAAFGFGLYLGSYGSGEGHLLRRDEIRRIYEIAVVTSGGRAPVYAAALGFTGTDLVIELAQEARAAGVDAVQIVPPRPGPPGTPPPPHELEAYYSDVLDGFDGDVHLSNEGFLVGYSVPAPLLARLALRYPQVTSVNATDPDIGHLVDLLDGLQGTVPVHVGLLPQLPTALALGAAGPMGFEATIAPEACAEMLDDYRSQRLDAFADSYRRMLRLHRLLMQAKNPRSVKAALNLLGVPAGATRRPYLPLREHETAQIRDGLVSLGLLHEEPPRTAKGTVSRS
jgi:4-hydroxy-tetrahydrodipicolinate synthase